MDGEYDGFQVLGHRDSSHPSSVLPLEGFRSVRVSQETHTENTRIVTMALSTEESALDCTEDSLSSLVTKQVLKNQKEPGPTPQLSTAWTISDFPKTTDEGEATSPHQIFI